MEQTITSDVFGVLNLTTGDEFVRVEQTAKDGARQELRFPPKDAADIALRVLYLILKSDGKAIVSQSPFYTEVKNLL